MRIKKALNTNAVIAIDANGNECVLLAKGIGYNVKAGQIISEKDIDKMFVARDTRLTNRLIEAVKNIPIEHIKVGDEIVNMIAKDSGNRIGETTYIALIDHISYAITRHEKKIDISNPLLWEIKYYYPKEFELGKKALEIINRRLGVQLPEDEAAFITFHILDSLQPDHEKNTRKLELIEDVMTIVKRCFPGQYDESSYSFKRFMKHLKYFSSMVLSEAEENETSQKKMTEMGKYYRICAGHPGEAECVREITQMIEEKYDCQIDFSEKIYLMLHLSSIRG